MLTVDTELADLWARFKVDRSREYRDRLIVHYAPLVKFVAGRIAAGMPQSVDKADLASYGVFGLIDAIDKFDPDRGFKFETYASSRIKGAILDELRSIDWVPRTVRTKARSVEQAFSKLESTLHRNPTDAELAGELDLTAPQLQATLSQISTVGLAALDELLIGGAGGDSMTLGDTIPDAGDGPDATFERRNLQATLGEAIERMPDREKVVLTLYYYEGFTLAQIGHVLEVTESRVCQIHTKAVLHLRSRMTTGKNAA